MLSKYLKIKASVFTTKAFAFTVFIIIAYQTYFIFFGLDVQDSFFHATKMVYDDAYVLTFLSYKVGYLWSLIFGTHILSFRLFNVLLHVAMLLSPLCLVKQVQQKYYFYLLLILVNVFFTLMNWNILGYDSFSFLSVIITTILSFKFIKNSGYKNLIFVAISIALSVAFRFPNIVLLPVFVVIIGYQSFYKKVSFFKYFLILIASVTFFYGLLIVLFFDSFSVFKSEFLNALAGTGEQHGVSKLIHTYTSHFFKILKFTGFLILFYGLFIFLRSKKISQYFYVLPVLLGAYLYYKFIYGSGYNARVSMFMGAIMVSVIMLHVFYAYKKHKKLDVNTILVFSLVLFLFVPAMGSKSGLKYSGIFIVFLPFLYHFTSIKIKPFFILLLVILLPLAVKERFGSKFMDSKHSTLTSAYNLPKINGVFTTQNRVALSDSIAKDYKKYKTPNNKIIFYGLNSYMYNYVLGQDKICFETYRMDLDHEAETRKALSMISKANTPVFFIVSSQIKRDTLSLFESEIISKFYSRDLKKGYVILYPNTL